MLKKCNIAGDVFVEVLHHETYAGTLCNQGCGVKGDGYRLICSVGLTALQHMLTVIAWLSQPEPEEFAA